MERIDIAVIGGGPAAISAAITGQVRNKQVLLIRARTTSRKVSGAHLVRNYPGLGEISGSDFADALERHLQVLQVPVLNEQVSAVYAMGSYYAVQTAGNMLYADTVILATGVAQTATLPGEDALLGRGVSYCATCDGMLYRGKRVAVLGYTADGKEAEQEVRFLAQLAETLVYFPRENADQAAEALADRTNVTVISDRPTAILGERTAEAVQTGKGRYPADGVFVLRDAVAADKLVFGLKMDGGHVLVDRQMRTNLAGCFACGDITGQPYQYVKAAGEGNVAALSAVAYLAAREAKG